MQMPTGKHGVSLALPSIPDCRPCPALPEPPAVSKSMLAASAVASRADKQLAPLCRCRCSLSAA